MVRHSHCKKTVNDANNQIYLFSLDLTKEHFADIGLLLGYIPVESAEVPRMLKEIANEIYICGKSDEFEKVSSSDGMRWLEMNCTGAYRLIKDFLKKHGHRSLKEVNYCCKNSFLSIF